MSSKLINDLTSLADLVREPDLANLQSTWLGHIPFARWLVKALRPSIFVELGVFRGDSYCAFCDAFQRNGLPTKAFGIDTWRGDLHVGRYGEQVLQRLREHHDARFGDFSTLIRSDFSKAAEHFDRPIDLLHIDGCHTYDAVKLDYTTWLPKMTDRGVILFHDTQERTKDFGVWKLWGEVAKTAPSFEFHHEHGLGVFCVGQEAASLVRPIFDADPDDVRKVFTALGAQFMNREAAEEIDRLKNSMSWRITAPLRRVHAAVVRRE